MQIDFRMPGAWSALNDSLADRLGLNLDKTVARLYQGTSHALHEVMWGLAKLFPQRKKIYYFKNMDPTFDSALMSFAKEGYQLVTLELSTLSNFENFVSSSEDLLILYSSDDPLLGRAYDVAKFEAAIKSAGLFKVRVSHARHFYEGSGFVQTPAASSGGHLLDRNWAYIYALSSNQSFALLGERGKIGAMVADQLLFDEAIWSQLNLDWFYQPQALNSATILSFEAGRVAGAQPFFSLSDMRIGDRAVIYWEDIDGHAVIDRLATQMGLTLNKPGYETRLETTSLSRWGGVRTMDFFKLQMTVMSRQYFSADQKLQDYAKVLRGLIIISHELLNANLKLFEAHLCEVRKSILQDQNG